MPLTNFLSHVRRDVPQCVGAALVDLERGALLATDTRSLDDTNVCDLAAAAAPDLLALPEGPAELTELVIVAHDRLHVWLRASTARALLVLCEGRANLGAVLARSRALRPRLAEVAA